MSITKEKAVKQSRTALRKKLVAATKKKVKSLVDFYGKLPDTFGNGAEYQKELRNEWQ